MTEKARHEWTPATSSTAATGFIITFMTLVVGTAIGAAVQFNDQFMFGFKICLAEASPSR